MTLSLFVAASTAALVGRAAPRPVLPITTTAPAQRAFPPPTMLLDPSLLDPSLAADSVQHLQHTADTFTNSLAFADQGGNLAGKFFQYSLAPYLGFLYFLKWEKNGTPPTAFFGFQFLLLFVVSTVVTGIVSKSVYGCSLADVDWLHGAAEALLTTSNLLVAFGFRGAIAGEPQGGFDEWLDRPATKPALGLAALVFASAFAGPQLGLQAHDAFIGGVGALPADVAGALPSFGAEPVNALSVPTWAIHFSSVFEWLFAMGLVWQFAAASNNPKWKGLVWGMLPLHASGVAACTYHFFFNPSDLSFLVALQAGLTLLGNTTVCIAALRIALSNGWTLNELNPTTWDLDELNPFSEGGGAAAGSAEEDAAPVVSNPQPQDPAWALALKLTVLTTVAAYAMKYGELATPLPFEPNAILATLLVLGIPAGVAYNFYSKEPLLGSD